MLIKEKFERWVDSQRDEFTLGEAKSFYDSVATGDPKFTHSAVYRLLGEFAEFVGYRSAEGGMSDRIYKSKVKPAVLPADLKFVYTGDDSKPRIVMADVPAGTSVVSKEGIESMITGMINTFEADIAAHASSGQTTGFKQIRCCTSGATLVVVYVSPLGTNDFSRREYTIMVSRVEQRGNLQVI